MELSESWKWLLSFVVGSFVTIGGALGINRLLLNRQKHNSQIANRELDFDQTAFKIFLQEFEGVKKELKEAKAEIKEVRESHETEIKKLREELAKYQIANARLETDNGHLQKENETLRGRVREMEREFSDTRIEMGKMKHQIEALQKG